jgi:hypothetical protein
MKKRHRPAASTAAKSSYTTSNTYEEWLDSQDVCLMLHISRRTLHTRRRAKLLPYYKMGGKFYYKRSDVDKSMEKGKVV